MSKHSDDDNLAQELSLEEVELEETNSQKDDDLLAIRLANLAKLKQKIIRLKKESSKVLKEAKEYRLTCEHANEIAGVINGKFKGK